METLINGKNFERGLGRVSSLNGWIGLAGFLAG